MWKIQPTEILEEVKAPHSTDVMSLTNNKRSEFFTGSNLFSGLQSQSWQCEETILGETTVEDHQKKRSGVMGVISRHCTLELILMSSTCVPGLQGIITVSISEFTQNRSHQL